jgi:hypothetical protein
MQSLAIEQGGDLRVVGKAVGLALGKQGLAIGDDLERAGSAGDEFDLDAISLYKQVPRTERTRLVVSNDAVFDADFRRGGHAH